jgi:hypothetical protein
MDMTRKPENLDVNEILVLNVRDTIEAARHLVGAQGCHLQLSPNLLWVASRLSLVGVSVEVAPVAETCSEAEKTHCPDIVKLPLPQSSPTDRIDIGVIIRASDGPPFAMMKLERVPVGWSRQEALKGLGHLKAMQMQQFEALALGPALVAAPMLRLCGLVRELDDQAVSHALFGLLRVLADEQPNRVETMAMRICGLTASAQPYLEEREIVLGPVALDLLDKAGIRRTSGQLAFVPEAGHCERPTAVCVPPSLAPFATMRALEEVFEVAEDDKGGLLWFRPEGSTGPWVPLAAGFEDGWAAIAVEVLGQTRDILRDYAKMHLIRRRDLPTDEVAEAYELDGVIWWLRDGEAGTEARMENEDWRMLPIEADQSARLRAMNALFLLDSGAQDRLSDSANDWVRRMAQAVHVMPCAAIAAE